jgi:hypothetical protein
VALDMRRGTGTRGDTAGVGCVAILRGQDANGTAGARGRWGGACLGGRRGRDLGRVSAHASQGGWVGWPARPLGPSISPRVMDRLVHHLDPNGAANPPLVQPSQLGINPAAVHARASKRVRRSQTRSGWKLPTVVLLFRAPRTFGFVQIFSSPMFSLPLSKLLVTATAKSPMHGAVVWGMLAHGATKRRVIELLQQFWWLSLATTTRLVLGFFD